MVTQRDTPKSTTPDAQINSIPIQIDESLVEHLLSLSHEQRIDAHEQARELAQDLRQAGKEFYARQSQVLT